MKSLIRYLSFLVFALIMVFSTAKAAENVAVPVDPSTGVANDATKMMIRPDYPVPPQDSFPFGQNQRYSVVFRGNGEAVVTLNTTFSNSTDKPLSQLSFRVPKGVPSDIIAYQVIAERQCIQYDYSAKSSQRPTQPPCLQYQEPTINQYIQGYNVKYQKAKTDIETDTIIVTLPKSVIANGAGGLMLYYRSGGYAHRDVFGGFDFSFETLKIEDKIQSLQVGISTDSELILKNTQSSVNYRFSDASEMMKVQDTAGMAAPMANAQMDTYYRQIGQGSIVKTSSNLQPLDSYTVTGRYAKSTVQLYAKELTVGSIILLVLIVLFVLLTRWIIRKWVTKPAAKNATMGIPPIVSALVGSFVTALFTIIYTILLMFLVRVLPYYLTSDFESLVIALLLVVSLGIYGFLLFAAPIWVGIKRGLTWGAATLGLCIGWIILFLFLLLIFFFVTRGTPMYYPPVYQTMRAESGVAVPQAVDMEKALPQESL